MASTATVTAPDLLSVLRERQAQAQNLKAAYGAPVVAHDAMLHWLAAAAKAARQAAGRKQVHIAAQADVDQSTVYRFEAQGSNPRDLDGLINAYADDLEIDPIDIWTTALHMWHEDRQQRTVSITPEADERFARTARAEARRKRERREATQSARVASDAQETKN